MKSITFNSQGSFKAKQILTAGALALTVFTGVFASSAANAGLVTGTASFTIDNAAVSASTGTGAFFFDHQWGVADNSIEINASTLGGTAHSNTETFTFFAPVNTNTTDIAYSNSVPEVIRTTQGTTMDTSNLSVGSIGLSGALRMAEPTGLGGNLTPFDFDLYKTGAGDWLIGSNGAGFPPANVFRLVDVVESSNGSSELLLSGNLKWTAAGISYAGSFGFDTDTVIGSFSLTPSAVPVPAAVWLFGSGLLGLVATGRKKAKTHGQ